MKLKISVFFCLTFIIGTDTFLVSPLLPTLRYIYGISVEQSGWIISAYALGYAVFALIVGPLSDQWNRKTVMIAGTISFAFFTFLCGFASTFWLMILFRMLAGMSAAITSPQVWAAIPQLVPRDKVLKGMGIATAGLAAAQMLGVPIGSYLALFGWRIPFFSISAGSCLLVCLIIALLPSLPPAREEGERRSLLKNYLLLLRNPGSKQSFFAYFIFQMGNFAAFSFIGIWLSDQFQLNVAGIGTVILVLGFGNMLSSFFSSGFVHSIGVYSSFIFGMGLVILIYGGLPYLPSLFYVTAAYFFLFLILGMIFPIMMNTLQNLSSTVRGTISSLANASMYLRTTIGSSLGGWLYANAGGFKTLSIFTVVCFLLSFLLFMRSGLFPSMRRE
ncbi:MFS transporter [Sporolactobacillus sp. STCC-11]|uniref:MFS transporter n=1 Tax=Sporolactobacillus caesalpiniae TaxID=3230362 RepID=UPI0033946FB6